MTEYRLDLAEPVSLREVDPAQLQASPQPEDPYAQPIHRYVLLPEGMTALPLLVLVLGPELPPSTAAQHPSPSEAFQRPAQQFLLAIPQRSPFSARDWQQPRAARDSASEQATHEASRGQWPASLGCSLLALVEPTETNLASLRGRRVLEIDLPRGRWWSSRTCLSIRQSSPARLSPSEAGAK